MSTAGRHGKMTKSIVLETDDPKIPTTRLTVSVQVQVDLTLEKRYVHLKPISKGQESTAKVKILVSPGAPKVEFGEVTSNREGVTGEIITEDGVPTLLIRNKATKIGRLRALIKVTTNHPKIPMLMLTASGEVRGPITAQPHRVTLYADKGEAKVRLVSDAPFKITGVGERDAKGPPRVQAQMAPLQGATGYELTLTPSEAAKAAGKLFHTKIFFNTDNPEQPEVVIDFVYRTRQRGKPNLRALRKSPIKSRPLRKAPTTRKATPKLIPPPAPAIPKIPPKGHK